jgi:hypothetical protein
VNPLFDAYATPQAEKLGQALREAVRTRGDIQPALQLAHHLIAESGIPAEDRADAEDAMLATMFYELANESERAGHPDDAELYREAMVASCTAQSIERVICASFFKAGLTQGWLPAPQYDRVAALFTSSPRLAVALGRIERRDVPEPGPAGPTG